MEDFYESFQIWPFLRALLKYLLQNWSLEMILKQFNICDL